MIRPPHAPAGVRSEFGYASDLIPGALFRFVDAARWYVVYDTHCCGCGDGPWSCGHCRAEHDVLYGDAREANHDKHGQLLTEHEALTWDGFDPPEEVEFILAPAPEEKAALLATSPNSKPWQEKSNDRH